MAKGEAFERHRQPWTADEIQKLHTLAKKGMALKAIAQGAENAARNRPRIGRRPTGLSIAKLR
ncbi:MAG: hypothetical protein PGN08_10170 [Sphingomonas taxi]